VFRCLVYFHISKNDRKKLDPEARKTIFLGYGTVTKGYWLYDRKKLSIVHSRDVGFKESSRKDTSQKKINSLFKWKIS